MPKSHNRRKKPRQERKPEPAPWTWRRLADVAWTTIGPVVVSEIVRRVLQEFGGNLF